MIKLQSKKQKINQPAEKLFTFLTDLNHFEDLMPKKVTNWKSTKNTCGFTIPDIGEFNMRIAQTAPSSYIRIVKHGRAPFHFYFVFDIQQINSTTSAVRFSLFAEMNLVMRVLAYSPMNSFLNNFVKKLAAKKF